MTRRCKKPELQLIGLHVRRICISPAKVNEKTQSKTKKNINNISGQNEQN